MDKVLCDKLELHCIFLRNLIDISPISGPGVGKSAAFEASRYFLFCHRECRNNKMKANVHQ